MTPGAGVCMLASYPKSGNTWLRAMLTVCARPNDAIDLGDLVGANVLIDAEWFETQTGLDPAVMTLAQIDLVRSRLLAELGRRATDGPVFVKTHSVDMPPGADRAAAPDGSRRRSVVVVRHPFDVAVSYSKFISKPLDRIIATLGRSEVVIDPQRSKRRNRLPEMMGSWSENAASWLDGPTDSLLVRYEDMKANPARWLQAVLDHAGIEVDDAVVESAVELTDIGRLRALEDRDGFGTRAAGAAPMFRTGQVGDGRAVLDESQRSLLVHSCGAMMRRFGYLADGTVIPGGEPS